MKASLNLSVNAIIIFVLAFAMLAVGLFVTQELRNTAGAGLDKAEELIKGIEEEPTSDRVLVGVGSELDIPANKLIPLGLKFYNKDRETMAETVVVIDSCKDTSDGSIISKSSSGNYPVKVVSDTVAEFG